MHGSQKPTRGTLRIAETFTSVQGEGKLTGVESFFIRTSGCNLRCWFCDTPYASWDPEGGQQTLRSLVDQTLASGCEHVVLTGGEPLLLPRAPDLCAALRAAGVHVTVETAGTLDQNVTSDLMSISPKLRSSTPDAGEHPRLSRLHAQRRLPLETMRRLIERADDYQLKFVVDSPADYGELHMIAESLQVDPASVWVMPQGVTVEAIDRTAQWLRPWTDAQGFRYCDRMQIRWFGNRRGT